MAGSFFGNVVAQLAATMSSGAIKARLAVLEAMHWDCLARRDDRLNRNSSIVRDQWRPLDEAYRLRLKMEKQMEKQMEDRQAKRSKERADREAKPLVAERVPPVVVKQKPNLLRIRTR